MTFLKISRNNNIEDILYSKKEILLLDSSIGCLYSIHKKRRNFRLYPSLGNKNINIRILLFSSYDDYLQNNYK